MRAATMTVRRALVGVSASTVSWVGRSVDEASVEDHDLGCPGLWA
jgi:hypothetical protein